jgi:hypothetical protein
MNSAAPEHPPSIATPKRAMDGYECLMSVTVKHDFYGTDAHGTPKSCPDFVIEPTRPSQSLIHYLGLIARRRRDGIDILYRPKHSDGIIRYLWQRRHRRIRADRSEFDLPSARDGCWSRLGLTFTLRNDLFANFTDIPLSADTGDATIAGARPGQTGGLTYIPGRVALHLSNRHCAQPTGEPIKHRRSEQSKQPTGHAINLVSKWAERAVRMPPTGVWPGNIELFTDKSADDAHRATDLRLYDTSGLTLLYARPGAKKWFEDQKGKTEDQTKKTTTPRYTELTADQMVRARLSDAASGLYACEVSYPDQPDRQRTEFIISSQRTPPLMFADLHFASPDPDPDPRDEVAVSHGCYPIVVPPDADTPPEPLTGQVTPCHYEIWFEARRTTWIYYIVLPPSAGADAGLAIEPGTERGPRFHGPRAFTLPTDVTAYRFTSTKPWPLRHRPDVSLRLRGLGSSGGAANRILLERLPVPSAERLSLAKAPAGGAPQPSRSHAPPHNAFTSEMFVYV